MKHLFVINPNSGNISYEMDNIVLQIKSFFKIHSGLSYDIYITRHPRDAVTYVYKYVNSAKEFVKVFAVGGDGILFECLNGAVSCNTAAIGSIPYGTTNDFLKAFGTDNYDIFRSIEAQVFGELVKVDVFSTGFCCCLNYCLIGLGAASGEVAKKISNKTGLSVDKFYAISAVWELFKSSVGSRDYLIDIDGKVFNESYYNILVSNGPGFGKNAKPVPDYVVNDGLLDVMTIRKVNLFKAMLATPIYLKGVYEKFPSFIKHETCKKIKISSNNLMQINIEGEKFYDKQITITVLPKAVYFVNASGCDFVNK